jgi:TonB family protein
MFDQLVVSSLQRRKHTAAKYFFGTGALYLFAIACVFVTSILMSDPKLADTGNVVTLVAPSLPRANSPKPPKIADCYSPGAAAATRPDPNNVRNLDDILSRPNLAPPVLPRGPSDFTGENSPGDIDGQHFTVGNPVGVAGGDTTGDLPPRPADLPKSRPASQTTVADNGPMRVTSSVLQGKAIERRKPIYPKLAQQIRLQDEVSVEVMISPEGRVESARVVSGHPMFAQVSQEAALGWRFQPTLLNKVPVRVTGVIVFVFKLSE